MVMGNINILKRILAVLVLVMIGVGVTGVVFASLFPSLAAGAARPLRALIGVKAVAQLETAVFTIQDNVRQVRYEWGLAEAEAPWQVLPTAAVAAALPTAVPTPVPSFSEPTSVPDMPVVTTQPPPAKTATPVPTAVPTAVQWSLPPVTPFGLLSGEGEWQPYLYNSEGEVVGLRTFLQPDEERPYALVAVVAFDLTKTRLHYVLGYEEPALPGGPHGSGHIPGPDRQPGRLLATFNGGFMASHGAYGAMSDGLVALPAKENYATVAIAADGSVAIGNWGDDIPADGRYQAWRQNARLITQEGVINERVFNGSAATWGSSIEGDVVTWRSALGIDEEAQILFYAAGPSLSMPALARAMQAVGAENSLLLDINESWTHFAAIRPGESDEVIAEPLLEGMAYRANRYLHPSDRDFFYVTVEE